jgi:lysophospholipid hydrolase
MSDSLGDLELDPGRGNPLVALAIAIVKAFLYILGSIRYMVGWVTITLPG